MSNIVFAETLKVYILLSYNKMCKTSIQGMFVNNLKSSFRSQLVDAFSTNIQVFTLSLLDCEGHTTGNIGVFYQAFYID